MFRILSATAFAVSLIALSSASSQPNEVRLRFEVYKGKDKQFWWRLKSSNGEIIATCGQGFKVAADTVPEIMLVQKVASDDTMVFETYVDDRKQTRWRLKSANGQTIATCPDGFKSKADAEKVIATIREHVARAELAEVRH